MQTMVNMAVHIAKMSTTTTTTRSLPRSLPRFVRIGDVVRTFSRLPGDNNLKIESKPEQATWTGNSTCVDEGTLVEGTSEISANIIHSSPNQWVKTHAAESPWRKIFFKGLPLEVFRQILIKSFPHLYSYRFHEKNRGYSDWLQVFIHAIGVKSRAF
jgi:hypothetical protein